MAPEILDGTANCSSPLMSPSVCLSREQRHSDVAQVAKTAGCRIHHTIATVECRQINQLRIRHCHFHLLFLWERHSVSLLAFSFLNTCIDHKLTPATSYRRFSQLHSFFTEQHGRGKTNCLHSWPCTRTHTHAIRHLCDIRAINSLRNKIMINFMAVIYMKSLYYVH